MRTRQLGSLVALVSLAVTVGFVIYAAQPWVEREPAVVSGSGVFLVLLSVWAASPYIGALLMVRRIRKSGTAERIEVILLALVCLLGPALVVEATMGRGGAQGGLGFVFLPFLQWVGVGVIAAVFAVVRRRRAV
jgi:hypothetical protein